MHGNPRAGLRDLSVAAESSHGPLLGTTLYRRGAALFLLGNPEAARVDAAAALAIFRQYNMDSWLPSALQVLAECEARLGRPNDAAKSLEECRLLLGGDAGLEAVRLQMLEAWVSYLKGDLPKALAVFMAGEIRSIPDGYVRARVTMDVATIHLAAGLSDSAVELLESLDPATAPPILAAEWRSMLSRALLDVDQPTRAIDIANRASRDLKRMGLRIEAAEASLTGVAAQVQASPEDDLARQTEAVARNLDSSGSRHSADGWVLAGKVLAAHGLHERSLSAFASGAAYRESADRIVAASGWLSCALGREIGGQPGVLRACSRGLDALDEYRAIMGSSEVRAALTHRGQDLAQVALRTAAHNPRGLLHWSERWRATALAHRPVTPHGEVSPAVAMLRDSGRLIAEARSEGAPTEGLERERRRLERKVRSEHHQQHAEESLQAKRFEAAELIADVGDGAFVELVEVDAALHVLVVCNGRVRRVVAGDSATALELAEAGRFALRRAARTGRFAPGDLGQRFQDAVLGKAVGMLPDGPVTISPTAALHGAPFALMPALATRPFSTVPSAAQWMRALAVPTPRTKRRAFVSGPGLVTGGAEVERLAKTYPEATILRGSDATVAATMTAIDGAKLAHLATHGTFRADSPLFSALEMADGQLSVYELERLKKAPYRTILSACDSGVLAPVGAQEVLGLASALFSLGSAGLVCSIAEVNDEATADIMMRVHASLDAKRTPAEALAEVRAEGSPVEQATAAAFVALGV
jgi:tetratricopeptide (TPR) repeat protein